MFFFSISMALTVFLCFLGKDCILTLSRIKSSDESETAAGVSSNVFIFTFIVFLIQVLLQTHQTGAIFLGVSPLFQLSENREKLQRFISQYLYN